MTRRQVVRSSRQWQPAMGPQRTAGRRAKRLPRVSIPRPGRFAWRTAFLVAVLAAVGTGGYFLFNSPVLSVSDVSVEGNQVLSADLVRDVAALEGESLIRPDFAAAEERLLALPNVKSAHVERDWPFGVDIVIVERTAWGVWEAAGQRVTIDEEGVVLDLPAPEGAPLISSVAGPPEPLVAGATVEIGAVRVAQELVATAEQTVGLPVTSLEFSQATGLTAVLGGNLRVVFGDAQGYEFKIATLFAVLQQARERGETPSHVDLRFGDRVAVQ